MKKIKVADSFVIKKPLNGNPQYNEMVDDYAQNLLKWGAESKRVGVDIVSEFEDNIPFDIIDFIFVSSTLMGEVDGYRAIIKITVVELDEPTPNYLPNRIIKNYDDEGVELPDTFKTWREWIGSNYTITELDGFAYFCTQAGGRDLNNDEMCALFYDESYDIVDVKDFNELIQGDE